MGLSAQVLAYRWHGNGGATDTCVLRLPLRCDRLDLGVELDALSNAREQGMDATA